jgi:hypothetical protein
MTSLSILASVHSFSPLIRSSVANNGEVFATLGEVNASRQFILPHLTIYSSRSHGSGDRQTGKQKTTSKSHDRSFPDSAICNVWHA